MKVQYLLWAVSLLLAGCAGQTATLTQNPTPEPTMAAAERFYQATTAQEARDAVADARIAAPASPVTRELEGWLAWLEDRPEAALEAWTAVLLDAGSQPFVDPYSRLNRVRWTAAERRRVADALMTVARVHPDPAVRARAASRAAARYNGLGLAPQTEEAASLAHGRLPLTVIGPFDNDQGKGLQTVFEPETLIDFDAEYDGRLVPVRWRTLPLRNAGDVVHLSHFLYPSQWSVAYAATGVSVAAGKYELRITTGSPLAVWVNGVRIFDHPGRRGGAGADGVVLPVVLRDGDNRILVKTGNRNQKWKLGVRITGPGGTRVDLRAAAGDADVAPGPAPVDQKIAEASMGEISCGDGPRCAAWQLVHADETGQGSGRLPLAEAYLRENPDALLVKLLFAQILSEEGEKGRASDLLQELHEALGGEFPRVEARLGAFWRSKRRFDQAREVLLPVTQTHPDRPSAWRELGRVFTDEKWWEDGCAAWRTAVELRPDTGALVALADCLRNWNPVTPLETVQIWRRAAAGVPGRFGVQRELIDLAMETGDYGEARRRLALSSRLNPTSRLVMRRAGYLHRHRDDPGAEAEVYERWRYLRPGDPEPWAQLARLAYVGGDEEQARSLWAAALARDPDDKRLANRLDYVSASEDAPWRADVPTDKGIRGLVAEAAGTKVRPGASRYVILDHAVYVLRADGSASQYVTLVTRAETTGGRDAMTSHKTGRSARVRLAYAITAEGKRIEASSLRDGVIRFRELGVGAVTVIQFRRDSKPPPFLSGSRADNFNFDGVNEQRGTVRWIVWRPSNVPFHEVVDEGVRSESSKHDGWVRHQYAADDTGPLPIEPNMPPGRDARKWVFVSTVPSWESVGTWEKELIRDAFRTTPELTALAQTIFDGAADNREKVARLMSWIIKDIRYQQDYAGVIEGVKPHAAAVVMARRYGDCKDKAVLFISLARLGGIDAHFALVRTRGAGQVRREVPMQQFNHAIVYLPPQDGFPEGRFLDPTVGYRDVFALRGDDQGTLSLVYDPVKEEHTWREVPWDDADRNWGRYAATVTVAPDGSAELEVSLSGVGSVGTLLRRSTENEVTRHKLGEGMLNGAFPESTLAEVVRVERDDLTRPAVGVFRGSSKRAGRVEGDTMRLGGIAPFIPGNYVLSKRVWALKLGQSLRDERDLTFVLPAGAEIVARPADLEWTGPCYRASQKVGVEGNKVHILRRVEVVCHSVEPADYPAVRERALEIRTEMSKEFVIRVP
jgi:cellulose synthase operon protein C